VSEIHFEKRGPVGIITLAAPQRLNAFTPSMVDDLLRICDEVDADRTIGAAVIQAQGESFCAGAHREILNSAGKDPAEPNNFRLLGITYGAFVRVGELHVPSIAAVRGHVVGAGVNLMLATDLRVVAYDARIATGFMRIGLHPGGGHFTLLSRLAGRECSAAMSLYGQEIDGRRAVEVGIAWEAVPAGTVETRAFELAGKAGDDPELARRTVGSFRLELGPPALSWHAALELELGSQMWSLRRRHEPSAS